MSKLITPDLLETIVDQLSRIAAQPYRSRLYNRCFFYCSLISFSQVYMYIVLYSKTHYCLHCRMALTICNRDSCEWSIYTTHKIVHLNSTSMMPSAHESLMRIGIIWSCIGWPQVEMLVVFTILPYVLLQLLHKWHLTVRL